MIPVLYDSAETKFTTQGLGALADCISCKVTEERNGIYELEMSYPQTGARFGDILAGNIITAIPSPYRKEQPFRIYKVTKPLNGKVAVYAYHISYDLNKIPVKPFAAESPAEAMAGMEENAAIANDFKFWTDKTTSAEMSIEVPTAARSALGGQEGSILDTYGGEYEWDHFTVKLYNQRGQDSGVAIRYGKNLTGLTQEGDVSNLVAGIYPYWYSDGVLVECDPKIIYAEGMSGTAVPVDLTEKFESQPTAEQLQAAAESYIKSNDIGTPETSLEVEFLQLEQMVGYEDLKLLEKCDLCDTVTVQYPAAGIDVKAKIVSETTDVLLERYDKLEIGSARANIAQTIATQQEQIEKVSAPSYLQTAVNAATSWIIGGRGGYVLFQLNADGQPDEILILDTPDINAAQEVWRFNKGGLGHSSNGYNGSYETAITQDGAIVADFITAGTMQANRIKGGTLTLGGASNGNGVLQILDASGNVIGIWNNGGITAKEVNLSGIFTQYSDDGYLAVRIADNRVALYDWESEGTLCGKLAAAHDNDSGNPTVVLGCEPGGIVSIGRAKTAGGTEYASMIRCDASDTSATPYVVNTASGTLFPNNPSGGITVEHGFIKKWSMSGTTGALDLGPLSMTFKDGLVTAWSYSTVITGSVTIDGVKLTFDHGLLTAVS